MDTQLQDLMNTTTMIIQTSTDLLPRSTIHLKALDLLGIPSLQNTALLTPEQPAQGRSMPHLLQELAFRSPTVLPKARVELRAFLKNMELLT